MQSGNDFRAPRRLLTNSMGSHADISPLSFLNPAAQQLGKINAIVAGTSRAYHVANPATAAAARQSQAVVTRFSGSRP